MAQIQEKPVKGAVFDPLAAELAKIPKEMLERVRHDAAIFIAGIGAGMETARVQMDTHTSRSSDKQRTAAEA